jgi:hypothetical protein
MRSAQQVLNQKDHDKKGISTGKTGTISYHLGGILIITFFMITLLKIGEMNKKEKKLNVFAAISSFFLSSKAICN